MDGITKLPTSEMLGMTMMGGVNLPWIEVPKFDGTILKWMPFWEVFQTTIDDKTHLGDVDKVTCLQ